jgi:hypothetical protein
LHEFVFSDVSCPDRHVILQLPLREFCIGHRLIFLKQRNPLLWQSEQDFNALPFDKQVFWLIESVYTCAQSYAYRKRLESGDASRLEIWWHNFKVSAWHRRWKRRKTDWPLEIAKFKNYLAASRVITDFKEKLEGFPFIPIQPNPDAKGRELGSPYDAALIQFLISSGLCPNEAAAFEYPLARARVHYLTHLEQEGNLRVMNAFEIEFEEESARLDLEAAKVAGFDSLADYQADCMKKAREAKAKAEADQKATPPIK